MSAHIVSWAWKQKVGSARRKLLLMKLADSANDDGVCWPSVRTLARETEISKSAIVRELDGLERENLIRIERRRKPDGSAASNLYHVDPEGVSRSDGTPRVPRRRDTVSQPGRDRTVIELNALSEERAQARPLEELWNAIEQHVQKAPSPKTHRAAFAKLARELLAVGATPEQVRRRAAAYKEHPTLGDTMLTLPALAKWWDQLEADAKTPGERLREDMARRGVQ